MVLIEGAKMLVCERCTSFGSPYTEPKAKRATYPTASTRRLKPTKPVIIPKKPRPAEVFRGLEVVDGFGGLVRKARERMNLSHEGLGRRISEKVSVLKKVESGKIIPDIRLARKLEHVLKIRLLVPSESLETVKAAPPPPLVKPTLGDIVQLKTGKTDKRRT
jgi:putative transcription factor